MTRRKKIALDNKAKKLKILHNRKYKLKVKTYHSYKLIICGLLCNVYLKNLGSNIAHGAVFRIRFILIRIRILGSVSWTFLTGF